MTTAILVLARTLHIGSALLLVSLLFFWLWIIRPDMATNPESNRHALFSRRMARWWIGAFLIQVVSGGVWFWIVAADMSDNSVLDVFDSSILKTVFEQTQFGQLWLCRIVMAVVTGVIFIGAWRSECFPHGKKSPIFWIVLSLTDLLLISLAWAGHAAAGTSYRALHIGIDILHLALVAIWPVGLIPLAIFLSTLPKTSPPSELGYAILSLNRFSQTSLVAVILIFLTGLANACFLIPSFSALFTSTYGQLLLSKIVLFLLMVGLGAWNRLRYLPELPASSPTTSTFVKLQKTVLIENMLGLIVLIIVGVMGTTAPPQTPR